MRAFRVVTVYVLLLVSKLIVRLFNKCVHFNKYNAGRGAPGLLGRFFLWKNDNGDDIIKKTQLVPKGKITVIV